jgi:hypothetical protein
MRPNTFLETGPLAASGCAPVVIRRHVSSSPQAIGQTAMLVSGATRPWSNGESAKRPLHIQHGPEIACLTMAAGTSPRGRKGLVTRLRGKEFRAKAGLRVFYI